MNIAAVSPCFAPDAPDGASRYTGHLAQTLGQAGVHGLWLSTTAQGASPTSAWSSRWPGARPVGAVQISALRVSRFAATDILPALVWRIATRLIFTVMRARITQARERAVRVGSQAWREIVWPAWVEAYILAGLGPRSQALMRAFSRALPAAEATLIAYAPLGLAAQACATAQRDNRPVALLPLFHANDPLNSLPRWVNHYRRADAVLALTEAEAQIFRETFEHPNVHVIGAGLDPSDVLASSISGARFRKGQGLGEAPIALFLGRKEAGKNYRMAVEAVQRARALHPSAHGLRLIMIGADVDRQPLRPDEGLFLGPLSRAEALDALDACDVLINPSTSESFGLTILEAWARRKPVIANAACGPFRSIITDGHNGWLEADADGMARRIAQLLQQPALALAMGSAGHQTLMDEHLWPHVARRTLDALEGIRRVSAGP